MIKNSQKRSTAVKKGQISQQQSKTDNMVKNGQKQSKTVNKDHKWSKTVKVVKK